MKDNQQHSINERSFIHGDKPEEACGVFGVYAPEETVAKLAYFGLYALQHRGQESAGIATFDNGNLVNTLELRAELDRRNSEYISTTDSEMIAIMIGKEVDTGKDWVEAAISSFKWCQGAYSLVIGTPYGMMGARDPHGVRPLVIGTLSQENNVTRYVLASETCALDIIGAEYLRDVQPGELVSITQDGLTSHQWHKASQTKLCVFEMIYFARPDSIMGVDSLYAYRLRLGEQLAKESLTSADIVMGVPDSGIPASIGYSRQSGITYQEGLIKNRYVGRTFIQPTQHMREHGIRMKLNPLKDVLEGKRVIIIDDSIVRGTTSRKIVRALRDAGAIEVHMKISSPPVTHPCFYGIDTDSQDHLIAATKSIEDIARQIEVDSLTYLSQEGMLKVTTQNPENFCTACFNGHYPIDIPDDVKRSKLMLETAK